MSPLNRPNFVDNIICCPYSPTHSIDESPLVQSPSSTSSPTSPPSPTTSAPIPTPPHNLTAEDVPPLPPSPPTYFAFTTYPPPSPPPSPPPLTNLPFSSPPSPPSPSPATSSPPSPTTSAPSPTTSAPSPTPPHNLAAEELPPLPLSPPTNLAFHSLSPPSPAAPSHPTLLSTSPLDPPTPPASLAIPNSPLDLTTNNEPHQTVEVLTDFNSPVIMQPIILYQYSPGHHNDPFFNPDTLLNQREFVMRTGIEYLLLIFPSDADHLTQHQTIYPGNLPNPPEDNLVIDESIQPQVLCLKIKHNIPNMTMLVPVRTPLSFLLKSTKLEIKMHTIPVEQAEHCKQALNTNYLLLDLPPVNAPHRLIMFDDRSFQRPAPYYVPDHIAARAVTPPRYRSHNLLMRRNGHSV